MADMELSEPIQQLQQLDEMKNDTAITRRIKDVLRILSEDATKKTNLERLLENIRRSYRGMLHNVRKRKSNTSKLDKLYKLFHKSTIGEGIQLCSLCERELGIGEVPQTLWQLLLQKEFISFLQSELSTFSLDLPNRHDLYVF